MGLFPQPQQSPSGNVFERVQAIRQLMGGDPQGMLQQLMRTNPQMYQQFQQFMANNQGKTPEQVARENGIDYDAIRQVMGH